jgi:hypothetical protein
VNLGFTRIVGINNISCSAVIPGTYVDNPSGGQYLKAVDETT